ncbi:MAG: hypothetical protein ACK415_00765 [Thermodesulfovibrionales bacterium]
MQRNHLFTYSPMHPCIYLSILFSVALFLFFAPPIFAISDIDIALYQKEIADRPIGERIAFWAERFIGTLYDPDPLGEYVRKKLIVSDERVDCMYLSFRALELALSRTPEEAVEIALDKRFVTRGVMRDGRVLNYDERFQYGEDMLDSGKWGKEITSLVGKLSYIKGSRGRDMVAVISKEDMLRLLREKRIHLNSGDFIYFVKSPEGRIIDEIVGHIGIIKKEGNETFLIHAGGSKNKGGVVKKVSLLEYIESMPFAGIRIGRFIDP